MKIKKATQLVILVVALVSVIGVGAVSYAAWQGGVTSFTASASVGTVTLLGFDAKSMTFDNKLVPYNQADGTIAADSAKIAHAQLPSHTVTGAYQVKVSLNGTSALDSASKIYYMVNTTADQAVPTDLTGWTELGTAVDGATVTAGTETTITTLYVHLVLDSSAKTDMTATINLTVELVAAPVTTPAA